MPLIIRAPWITASVGQRTWQFAELIDIFPTLVELAGLPLPPAAEGLDGTSLVRARVVSILAYFLLVSTGFIPACLSYPARTVIATCSGG